MTTSATWRRAKGWPSWVLLAAVVVGVLVAGAVRDSGPRTSEERVDEIAKRIACPICDGESVFESRAAASVALRNEIQARVTEGVLTDGQIVSSIEDVYGAKVLLVPKATGLDALGVGPAGGCVRVRGGGTRVRVPTLARSCRCRALGGRPGARGARARAAGRHRGTDDRGRRRGRRQVNPDQLAELEDERRFLLRSLSDLDRELAAGDVDEHDYAVLRDGYTARAADVIRALDDDVAVRRNRPPRRWGVTLAWVVLVIVVAGAAGWLVAARSGQRDSDAIPREDAVTAKLSQARSAFAARPDEAVALYREVLDEDPTNPEARTYLGWLLAQASRASGPDAGAAGLAAAYELLREVSQDTPGYTDAHCLLAVVAGRYLAEPEVELARSEGRICMDGDPTGVTAQLVGPLMEELASAAGSPATTG